GKTRAAGTFCGRPSGAAGPKKGIASPRSLSQCPREQEEMMWSRVVEIMLGCWLMISPFIFAHDSAKPALWINDFSCGSAVILFALLSYWRPTRHAHLLTLAVGGWLIGFRYWVGFGSAPPAPQNHVIL